MTDDFLKEIINVYLTNEAGFAGGEAGNAENMLSQSGNMNTYFLFGPFRYMCQ
jgi:hypothetical protein